MIFILKFKVINFFNDRKPRSKLSRPTIFSKKYNFFPESFRTVKKWFKLLKTINLKNKYYLNFPVFCDFYFKILFAILFKITINFLNPIKCLKIKF